VTGKTKNLKFKMKIDTEIVLPGVYVIEYDTQYELCMSFVRLQEFYESQSPKIRGKYFTLEEFIDYWAKEFGNGSFDYPIRWNGFNLTSEIIDKWQENVVEYRFGPNGYYPVFLDWKIRARERKLLEAIQDIREQDEYFGKKYYVIGTHTEKSKKYSEEVISHECAHALYYLYPEYKKEANKLIEKVSERDTNSALKKLIKSGYAKKVLKDEMQAYFSTESEDKDLAVYKELRGRSEFAKNFNKYRQKWIEKNS
jgi:hypothetical protein